MAEETIMDLGMMVSPDSSGVPTQSLKNLPFHREVVCKPFVKVVLPKRISFLPQY
jgi:hypothetical protein